MSSKKSDDKNVKEEQKAIEEVEIVAELAPDEKTRKEAEKLVETVEKEKSSEIFDTYKQDMLKVTDEVSKFQPRYAESISDLQQEYLQLTKQFVDKFFGAQRNWIGRTVTSTTNTSFPSWPYTEQFIRQSDEITAQGMSVFDNWNQLAINALNCSKR